MAHGWQRCPWRHEHSRPHPPPAHHRDRRRQCPRGWRGCCRLCVRPAVLALQCGQERSHGRNLVRLGNGCRSGEFVECPRFVSVCSDHPSRGDPRRHASRLRDSHHGIQRLEGQGLGGGFDDHRRDRTRASWLAAQGELDDLPRRGRLPSECLSVARAARQIRQGRGRLDRRGHRHRRAHQQLPDLPQRSRGARPRRPLWSRHATGRVCRGAGRGRGSRPPVARREPRGRLGQAHVRRRCRWPRAALQGRGEWGLQLSRDGRHGIRGRL